MKIRQCLYIALASLGIGLVSACSDNEEASSPMFVQDARLQEEGQTLSPGDIVHLEGDGYQETDDVMLSIFWKTGETLIPEGSIIGYYAKILTKSRHGMTVQMPYRKPASRVEISILRRGEIMTIGTVYLTDGLTPSPLNLYGIVNHTKCPDAQDRHVIRWLDNENELSDLKTWTLDAHPDFHSTVGAYMAYGICGLSKENGKQYPYFLDLLTGEWEKLSDFNTISLFTDLSSIYALQSKDGKYYEVNSVSSELERSNYATASRASSPVPDYKIPLPEGMRPDFFGDYPGVRYDASNVLLSANKGYGKWVPVLFNPRKGFYVSDDIEAEALIPYSIYLKTGKNDNQAQPVCGYIVVLNGYNNGTQSLFYKIDDDFKLAQKPFATHPDRALSATANHDKPGTLTVHFATSRSENATFELSLKSNEWTSINNTGNFDEVVWIN